MAEIKQESKMGLAFELRNFTGTEKWYKTAFGGLLYTDGVKYLADQAGAYWLIDIIASAQSQMGDIPFQVWRLHVSKKKLGLVLATDGDDKLRIYAQKIPYTDFPLDEIELYVENKVICFPRER